MQVISFLWQLGFDLWYKLLMSQVDMYLLSFCFFKLLFTFLFSPIYLGLGVAEESKISCLNFDIWIFLLVFRTKYYLAEFVLKELSER